MKPPMALTSLDARPKNDAVAPARTGIARGAGRRARTDHTFALWKRRAAAPAAAFGWVLLPVCIGLTVVALAMRADFMDDAYIGFRYIDNLLAGRGFTFNPPQRIEGVTNSGWLLVIAPLAALLTAPIAAKFVALLAALATVVLSLQLARRLAGDDLDRIFLLPLPLLIATQTEFLLFSNLGMETPLLALGLCLLAWLAQRGVRRMSVAALAALLFTVHPECGLTYPLALALDCGRCTAARRRCLPWLLGYFGLVAASTLLRWSYFGDPLPNTFHAKSTTAPLVAAQSFRALKGVDVNIPFPFAGVLVLPFLVQGAAAFWRTHRPATACMVAVVSVGLAFGVYSGPDWTSLGRYFAPYVPVAFILLWRGLVDFGRVALRHFRFTAGAHGLVGAAAACALAAVGVVRTAELLGGQSRSSYPGYVLFGRTLVEPARWLRENLAPDAVLATRRIGAVAYFSDRRVFDYCFGLTERDVAAAIRRNGGGFHIPSHPVLAEIWKRVRPDYVLEDANVIDEIARAAGGTPQRFEIHGIAYGEIRRFRIGRDVDWVLCERL
jgi:hypothetical protein